MGRRRSLFPFILLGTLVFLMVGDRLPDPVGGFGRQAKQSVNGFVIGLFPTWDPDLNPNGRTESQLREMEH